MLNSSTTFAGRQPRGGGALSLFMDRDPCDIFGLNSFGESDIFGSAKIFQAN